MSELAPTAKANSLVRFDPARILDPELLLRGLSISLAQPPARQTNVQCVTRPTGAQLAVSRGSAQKAVLATCGFSAAIGAAPIPFPDAIPLTAAQVRLVRAITQSYGLPPVATDLTVLGSIGLAQGARKAGVSLAAKLLKLIPGPGTVIGAAVNASVAVLGTAAVGYAWIGMCEYASRHDVGALDDFLRTPQARLVLAELNMRAASQLADTLAPTLRAAISGKER